MQRRPLLKGLRSLANSTRRIDGGGSHQYVSMGNVSIFERVAIRARSKENKTKNNEATVACLAFIVLSIFIARAADNLHRNLGSGSGTGARRPGSLHPDAGRAGIGKNRPPIRQIVTKPLGAQAVNNEREKNKQKKQTPKSPPSRCPNGFECQYFPEKQVPEMLVRSAC